MVLPLDYVVLAAIYIKKFQTVFTVMTVRLVYIKSHINLLYTISCYLKGTATVMITISYMKDLNEP